MEVPPIAPHTPTDTMQNSDQCSTFVEAFPAAHANPFNAPEFDPTPCPEAFLLAHGEPYEDLEEEDVEEEEEEEEEYYEETPREHVYTTRSGRAVYSVKRLIVPIPGNDADLAALAEFDAVHGEDCEDGLSEHSANTTDDDDEDMSEMDESEEEEEEDYEEDTCDEEVEEEVVVDEEGGVINNEE